MERHKRLIAAVASAVILAISSFAWSQNAPANASDDDVPVKGAFDDYDKHGVEKPRSAAEAARGKGYSPYAGRKYPTRVYFGDTHNHTMNSGDAFMGGNRLSPEQAYRFARGEEVVSSTGVPVKLSRRSTSLSSRTTPRASASSPSSTRATRCSPRTRRSPAGARR